MEQITDFEELSEIAEILKSIAHPIRICIVRGLLREGECNVSKMQSCLNVPQSTLSQHLAKLRSLGIIRGRRHGTEIYYQVMDETVKTLIKALFEVNNNQ